MLVLGVCAVLGLLGAVEGTNRPIIGVLAQEVPQMPLNTSYIPAAYVKAVEASGARVVPIFINKTEVYYRTILSAVNGVLFPGGDVVLTQPHGFADAGRIILNTVIKMQDSGVSIPILGVCQGYELLMFLAANSNEDILVSCNAKNLALPLNFTEDFRQSSLYKYASDEILHILGTLPVTSNHHRFCVTENKITQFGLDKTWRVLSTNLDNNGLKFVSSSEHFQRPIVGVQFHPEKNIYEWNPKQANPHPRKAILSARLFYDWLVTESRLNNNSFPSVQEEENLLIFNYNPIYTGKSGGYDEQVYYFF